MAEEYAAEDQSTTLPIAGPTPGSQDVLTELLRSGARKLLAEAIEAGQDFADHRQDERHGHGARLIRPPPSTGSGPA